MPRKNKVLNFTTSTITSKGIPGGIKISGVASSPKRDRVGDVILPEAWKKGALDNYRKNPIILFNHDYDDPIGTCTNQIVSDEGLFIEAEISTADSKVSKLIEDGVLKAFSVSFGIKDADYDSNTDLFLIKDVELYEISVVSVPCHQDAIFSVSKSFDSEESYVEFKKQFTKPAESLEANIADAKSSNKTALGSEPTIKEKRMTPEEIQALIEKGIADGLTALEAKKQALEDAEKAKLAADEALNVKVTTAAEKLLADVEKRFADKTTEMGTTIEELQSELKAKSSEIEAIQKSKRNFADRSTTNDAEVLVEAEKAVLVGMLTKKGWDSKTGRAFVEKTAANSAAGVVAPTLESYETLVSTNIERDIQLELVLAPLFREIQMNSAVMKFPVLPDAGYAEFTAANTAASGSAYKGNLDSSTAAYGANAGIALQERTLSVKNIKSVSYIGNEVEEDAILPILPLIKESVIRSHARTVEHALLLGGHAQATVTNSFNGLAAIADANTKALVMGTGTTAGAAEAAFASTTLNATELLEMRRAMGKYGMRPSDVVYIVSEDGYYQLMLDADWQDIQQVGQDSMKLKGSIGKIYGSEVIVCPEFPAAAVGKLNAVALNKTNFVLPRLRGLTLESEYRKIEQYNAVIATQRLGFSEIIAGAPSVVTLAYPAA